MKYNSFQYMTPPRAKAKVPLGVLGTYERKGWIAQAKLNGQNSVIFVPPDRKPFAYNRTAKKHRTWDFTPESAAIFAALPGAGWWVLNAELLHAKVNGLRDTNYIHDVLVADGQLLLNTTYEFRHDMLCSVLPKLTSAEILETRTKWILNPHTWLAKRISGGFLSLYSSLTDPEDEGIILKRLEGKLSLRDGINARWMVKCRKPHKNYGF